MRRLAGNDPEVNEEWITDKDRFAFTLRHGRRPAHLPAGARRGTATLRPASWPEAFAVAARGLRAAGATGVLTGGRVTAEDAYAYSKFARVALGTNDIDFRARPLSAEEADFLAAEVVLRADGDVRRPRDRHDRRPGRASSPRTRPARSSCGCARPPGTHGTRVVALAPYASRGLRKMNGHAGADRARRRGRRARAARHARRRSASTRTGVILVGERLATSPGALTRRRRLARTTGARLAWVPRRAGDRGARRDRLPAQPAARWPSGRRRGRPRRRRHRVGRRRPARDRRARRRRDRRRARRRRARRPGRSVASTPTTPPTRPPPAPRSRPPRSWSRSSCARPT